MRSSQKKNEPQRSTKEHHHHSSSLFVIAIVHVSWPRVTFMSWSFLFHHFRHGSRASQEGQPWASAPAILGPKFPLGNFSKSHASGSPWTVSHVQKNSTNWPKLPLHWNFTCAPLWCLASHVPTHCRKPIHTKTSSRGFVKRNPWEYRPFLQWMKHLEPNRSEPEGKYARMWGPFKNGPITVSRKAARSTPLSAFRDVRTKFVQILIFRPMRFTHQMNTCISTILRILSGATKPGLTTTIINMEMHMGLPGNTKWRCHIPIHLKVHGQQCILNSIPSMLPRKVVSWRAHVQTLLQSKVTCNRANNKIWKLQRWTNSEKSNIEKQIGRK